MSKVCAVIATAIAASVFTVPAAQANDCVNFPDSKYWENLEVCVENPVKLEP